MKNKILHIVIKSSYNGATVYAVRLCSSLKEYDQEIVSCFNGNAYDETVHSGIACENLLNIEVVSYKYLLLKYWRFFRFIRKKNYDIIHYHQGGIGILLLAYLFRKKAVIIHHLHSGNLIGDNSNQNISFFHLAILKYLSNKTYQIAVAEHVFKGYYKKIGCKQKLKLIRNSSPFAFEKKISRKNSIGFIGRFTKEKGFSFLPDISVKLEQHFQDLKILIIGDEPGLFTKDFINSGSNIKLLEPGFSIEKFYRSIDLLLFLSTAPEGMPLVALEALSFNVGIVAYPSPALKEIFGEDYPLFINSQDEIMNVLTSYYGGQINLSKLNSIHKNVSIRHSKIEMLDAIRKLYVKIIN